MEKNTDTYKHIHFRNQKESKGELTKSLSDDSLSSLIEKEEFSKSEVTERNSISIQKKGFSVNENLHYLNITKVFKYKSNIKISLDGSKPIIIVLNCEVLCLKPRKVHFV